MTRTTEVQRVGAGEPLVVRDIRLEETSAHMGLSGWPEARLIGMPPMLWLQFNLPSPHAW